MKGFNTERIKQLRERRFARTTLAAIGLAAAASILLLAVWDQGNAKAVPTEAPHLTMIVTNTQVGTVYPYLMRTSIHGTGFKPTNNTVVIEFCLDEDYMISGACLSWPYWGDDKTTYDLDLSSPQTDESGAMWGVLPPGKHHLRAIIAGISSANGSEITFDIPRVLPISRGEGGGLQGAEIILGAGEYRVSVTTSAGASDALTFTLTPWP
jgi:hypothetical protein